MSGTCILQHPNSLSINHKPTYTTFTIDVDTVTAPTLLHIIKASFIAIHASPVGADVFRTRPLSNSGYKDISF